MKTPKHTTIELSNTVEIPWNQLRKDDANVRTLRPDNAEDAALIANIGETGVILENLIVRPNNRVTMALMPSACMPVVGAGAPLASM